MQSFYNFAIYILAIFIAVTHSAPHGTRDTSVDGHLLLSSSIAPHSSRDISASPNSSLFLPLHENHVTPPLRRMDAPSIVTDGTLIKFADIIDDEDKQVFDKELVISLGQTISGGRHNRCIKTISGSGKYKGYSMNRLLIKVLNEANPEAYGEVKALRAMNLLVDSGYVKDPLGSSDYFPAIVIERTKGTPLKETKEYRNAKRSSRTKLQQEAWEAMCKQVAADANRYHVYHDDNNLEENTLITFNGGSINVKIIDYGNSYAVVKEVSKKDLYNVCMGY